MHLKNTQQALKNQCFHMATLWGTPSPCPPSCTNIFLATPFDKFKAWDLKKKKSGHSQRTCSSLGQSCTANSLFQAMCLPDPGHHARWADSGGREIYSANCHQMFAPHCLFELGHVCHWTSSVSPGLSSLPPLECFWTAHPFGDPDWDAVCKRSRQPEEFITFDQSVSCASNPRSQLFEA